MTGVTARGVGERGRVCEVTRIEGFKLKIRCSVPDTTSTQFPIETFDTFTVNATYIVRHCKLCAVCVGVSKRILDVHSNTM